VLPPLPLSSGFAFLRKRNTPAASAAACDLAAASRA
jgi:hypothetical protein